MGRFRVLSLDAPCVALLLVFVSGCNSGTIQEPNPEEKGWEFEEPGEPTDDASILEQSDAGTDSGGDSGGDASDSNNNGFPAISNIRILSDSVPVFEKFEVRFDIATVAPILLFEYSESPPPGVTPRQGITVFGIITTPSKTTLQHPAFFTQETQVINPGTPNMYFVETGRSYWALRFSPMEAGEHQITLSAQDSTGTNSVSAGTFTATAPNRPGFIRVSTADARYFKFDNGDLYWPIGPAWIDSNFGYSAYKNTGQNFERSWMGGSGAYSTNWARWKSSAEQHGNEGIMTRLTWREHAPSSELAYELFYPEGYRMWLTSWMDDRFAPRYFSGKKYKVKLTYKTVNVVGPSPRCPSCPHGLVIRSSDDPGAMWGDPTLEEVEQVLRSAPKLVDHLSNSADWQTMETTFQAPADSQNLHIYLDNVTSGQAYIDEFSVKEIDDLGNVVSGELVRNPRADQHTYVEARAAAFFDWQLMQAEENQVAIKYVVHDKNDWIQNHLQADGQFVDSSQADGYYQAENTKARWLMRQWYRYVIARYGFSTSLHSYELNNEGPPNEEGNGTAVHWETAQAFARFMHQNDAHRHLANTSFWCCWRPSFWGNHTLFPDVDHGDIHDYTSNSSLTEFTGQNVSVEDVPSWIAGIGKMVMDSQVGMPVIIAESGLVEPGGWDPLNALETDNPGIWYHDLLWSQLNAGSVFSPNYWFSEHLDRISRTQISPPFHRFVSSLDVSNGGYEDIVANLQNSNSNIRIFGQIHCAANRAYLWVKNKNHSWANPSPQSESTTITIGGFSSNQQLSLESWDTYSGDHTPGTIGTNGGGEVSLQVNSLTNDQAFKIGW